MTQRLETCGVCLLPLAQHGRRARRSLSAELQAHLRTCDHVHRVIARLQRGLPSELPCRFGDGRAREPGRTVCDFHLVLKQACLGCHGPIVRREGRGRQPDYCEACDQKRAPSKRRASGDEVQHG